MIPFDAGVDIETKKRRNVGWLCRDDDAHSTAFSARIRASSLVVVEHFLWPNGSFKFGCLQDLPDMLYSLPLSPV
jgi:hypothetical protein